MLRTPTNTASHQSRSALTYLDMTIAVLIVGVMAATAVPRYADALARQQARAAALRVAAELEYARQLAIARSANVTLRLSSTDHTCSIDGATHLDRTNEAHRVVLSDTPYRAQLQLNGGSTTWQVTFNLHGVPSLGGSATLTSGGRSAVVTLDAATGRASVP